MDEGVPIKTCLHLFIKWINRLKDKHKFVINNIVAGYKTATFVTWYVYKIINKPQKHYKK